jgi:hypothetical protein
LIPVTFRLNFNYHHIFGFTFIAEVGKLKEQRIYGSDSIIQTDDILVVVTDINL